MSARWAVRRHVAPACVSLCLGCIVEHAAACNCVFKGYQPATTKALVQLSSLHGSGAVDQVASIASLRALNEMDW